MALTRKHFNKLADILGEARARQRAGWDAGSAIHALEVDLAEWCQAENAMFDIDRFFTAVVKRELKGYTP